MPQLSIYLREKLKRPFVFLVRKRALGDVLWIEPAIRQLATTNKKVIVYTKYPELFLHYPLPNVRFTSRLLLWEKMLWALERNLHLTRFFIDLDHAYENNSKVHFLTAYQQAAGLPVTHEYPRLYLDAGEKNFRPAGVTGRYIVLHLESMTDKNYRKVYGIDWETVVSNLTARSYTVLLIGKEPLLIPGARIVRTSIREMIALINGATLFIGIDSGPSHLAAALATPALIFFGAVNPDFRHFRDLFKGQLLQQPCEYAGWYHEANDRSGWSCRLVGDEGIPKCALFSTAFVLNNIDLLFNKYPV
jgi:ADP-heptose:LPS heptosyltransferase